MTKPNYSEIVVVLDRSGSMASIREDMIGGFAQLIEEQKQVPGECSISLVQFDTDYEEVYNNIPLQKVGALNLVPRGSTALLDALGRTIDATGRRLAAMAEEDRPSNVIFVIITDGQENASHEFTKADILQRITHQREAYKWEFVYLGANQDAYAEAAAIGIAAAHTYNYCADSRGVADMYGVTSKSVRSLRTR